MVVTFVLLMISGRSGIGGGCGGGVGGSVVVVVVVVSSSYETIFVCVS